MTERKPIPAEVKAHPSYSDGYTDAFEGYEAQGEQPAEYYVGYEAGEWAVSMFKSVGFERSGDGLSLSFEIGGKTEH